MTPAQFTACMRKIADEPNDRLMEKRALAHCLDQLEQLGYGAGIAVLHDRLTPVPDLNPRSRK